MLFRQEDLLRPDFVAFNRSILSSSQDDRYLCGCLGSDLCLEIYLTAEFVAARRRELKTPRENDFIVAVAASTAALRSISHLKKDIRYVPTPINIVERMLDLGGVGVSDFLIDLGSGDGRIPIEAAKRGATARGIEIDPSLASRSAYLAQEAGLAHTVDFLVQDLFEAELTEATIVTLYLRHWINASLQPKLQNELKRGTRVVSHSFCMVDWEPDIEIEFDTKLLFLWTVQ